MRIVKQILFSFILFLLATKFSIASVPTFSLVDFGSISNDNKADTRVIKKAIDACHNVVVGDYIIDSSDDALGLKSKGTRACEDVLITNCILKSHASMLKLGKASIGGFKRITISNIIISPFRSKEMHHPIGSWRGLAGIDILNVYGGILEDVNMEQSQNNQPKFKVFISSNLRFDIRGFSEKNIWKTNSTKIILD